MATTAPTNLDERRAAPSWPGEIREGQLAVDGAFAPNSVELEVVLNAIAAIDAAYNTILALNFAADVDAMDALNQAAAALTTNALGTNILDDATFESWPPLVEVEARGYELSASLLTELADEQTDRASHAFLRERVRMYTDKGRQTREAGRLVL
jgi:hypothetical protein